jgi:hypothetical protein
MICVRGSKVGIFSFFVGSQTFLLTGTGGKVQVQATMGYYTQKKKDEVPSKPLDQQQQIN